MSANRSAQSAIDFPIPLIGFAAYSGTGKTTLLLKLIPLLKQAGLHIAVIKHAHHSFDMDHPGKDSCRLREAGADQMLVAARSRFGWIQERPPRSAEPTLSEALAILEPDRLDLVLVEGFKAEPYPKIELHRPVLGRPLLFPRDSSIVAIATDGAMLAQAPDDLPLLSINDPAEIAGFVFEFIGWSPGLEPGMAC